MVTRLAPVLALLLAGCVSTTPRAPLPEAYVETARIDGFERIRFWGDEVSPTIRAVIAEQYRQMRAASRGPVESQAAFLAISGGGGDGAYAAGLLNGWSERGDRPRFEVVTGVSTGALAAPFAFLGPDEDGTLAEIYTAYGDGDLYRGQGLFGLLGNAVNDTEPLRRLIERYMTEDRLDRIAAEHRLGRRLLVQTTNLDAQRPVIWNLSGIAASGRPDRRRLVVQVLLASTAIPAIFPPVRITVTGEDGRAYDELHADGGVTAQAFFAPPGVDLSRFEASILGRTRARTLYVIRNGRLRPAYEPTQERTLALAARSLSTLIKYQGLTDLRRLDAAARAAGARLLYTAIPTGFDAVPASEFDRAYMRRLYEVGREVGRSGAWGRTPPAAPALAL